MESVESTLVPGYRLDRYELLCPIASGGMASVWLGQLRGKRGFEKLFAIKTIKTELISDSHFQEMFLDEARIASRIIHPNVAQILELGEENDILFLVMEYVDGDSVAKVNRLANKRGSPLPPGVAMRIVADMCAGLHAAHQLKDASGESLGVIHRDVSPQNILVASSGEAKVIDFGLVKAKNRSAAETQSGVVKGKIRYMAPEQVSGKAIDHRADIWAAGMCLYELISGHVPYHQEDDLDIVKRLMSSQPLPSVELALPPQIEKILARAIVPDPDGRFETCAAMRRAIEAAIHELGVPGEPEDVSDFVKTTLPELASKREKTIEQAMAAASARRISASNPPPPMTASLSAQEPGELAFANTEVSARDPARSDLTVPVTRRNGDPAANVRDAAEEAAPDTEDDSDHSAGSSYGTPAGTTLREQLGEQKSRSSVGFWLAAFAIVGAGTAVVWSLGGKSPPPPAVTATPPPSVASAPPPPSASAVLTESTPEPVPVMSALPADLDLAHPDAGVVANATGSGKTMPPAVSGRPRSHVETAGTAPATSSDGGLSPGARAAAAIMLTPKAPEPSPTSSATWPNTPDDPSRAQ